MVSMKKGKADTFPMTLASKVRDTEIYAGKIFEIHWDEFSLYSVSQSACLNQAHWGLLQPDQDYHGPVCSAIFEIKPEHANDSIQNLAPSISKILGCNAASWWSKLDENEHPEEDGAIAFTAVIPFTREVQDPREFRALCNMIDHKMHSANIHGLCSVELRYQKGTSPITLTEGHGFLDVDKVLEKIPAPDRRDSLSGNTMVDVLDRGKAPLGTLKVEEKFICPVCKDHPFIIGLRTVALEENEDGRVWFDCPQCQILGNGYYGQYDVEELSAAAKAARSSDA